MNKIRTFLGIIAFLLLIPFIFFYMFIFRKAFPEEFMEDTKEGEL